MFRFVNLLGIIVSIQSLHAGPVEMENDCLIKFFEPISKQCPWEVYKTEKENVLCKYRVLRLVAEDENSLHVERFIGFFGPYVAHWDEFEAFSNRARHCVKAGDRNHPYNLSLVEQFGICMGFGIKELSDALCIDSPISETFTFLNFSYSQFKSLLGLP